MCESGKYHQTHPQSAFSFPSVAEGLFFFHLSDMNFKYEVKYNNVEEKEQTVFYKSLNRIHSENSSARYYEDNFYT